jgi:hypothetical protein
MSKIPKYKWKLMSMAKRTGGWDIWLGKKWGWELDDDLFSKPHWHFNHYPFVVYRDEY